jgi:hypothetical protein
VTLSFNYGFANIDTGETLTVEFAADGVTFVTVGTISGGGGDRRHARPEEPR